MIRQMYMRMDENKGEGGSGAGGGSGETKTITNPGAVNPPANAPSFSIPDTYKDKPYLKDVKGLDDVLKMLDGAQTVLGKRPAGVPDDKAAPEEWNKFYAAAGRPEKADAYEFDDTVLGEGITRDPEVANKIKGIFHAAGLSSKQAKSIQASYDKMMNEQSTAQAEAAKADNAKFDTDAIAVFGARKDEALQVAKDLISEMAPASMKEHLSKLGNTELLTLASILDTVNSKYIKEAKAPGAGGAGSGKSTADLEKEAYELMATPKYKDALNPEYNNTRSRVSEIWKQVSASKQKA